MKAPLFAAALSMLLLLMMLFVATSQAQANPTSSDNSVTTNTAQSVKKIPGITGNLSSVGSDTLANMMTYWGEAFSRRYPNVNVQIQAPGSSSAPVALLEGTAQLGPMSRPMKAKEIEVFEQRFGYPPTAIRVAIDAMAVFVHRDNPIEGLSIQQVDAIFSNTLRCGETESIERWGQLGLTGDWAAMPIQRFGRNSVSGTYGYFKTRALCQGDFRTNVNEQPGSASVVQSVSTSVNSIGYSGIGYDASGVRAVPIANKEGQYIAATANNASLGHYPLARFLYIYVNKAPDRALDPLTAEFIRFILSNAGQSIVTKEGYIALPSRVIAADLKRLGLSLQKN
nr:PstS family phosphate ABC transporter substrate-binding protein [Vibrio stylophorae]